MSLVYVTKTDSYEKQALVDQAVEAHLDALGLGEELTPDLKVLIKPNLLAARSPSQGVTTHPAVLSGVVRYLRNHGVTKILIGDTPGGMVNENVLDRLYEACGLTSLEAELNRDLSTVNQNGFTLLKAVTEADLVINCCKLKTHGLTVMSGAVKNLFGCIPGLKKPEWHCARPTVESFSNLLLDLEETIRPAISLMDAIDCMEGNGPGGGTLRHMGYLLSSRSPCALDAKAAELMGLPQSSIPLLRAAEKRDDLSEPIELAGDPLLPASPPFVLPDSVRGTEHFFTPTGLFHSFFGKKRAYPKVDPDKCVGCGRCRESCPQHIIRVVDHKAQMPKKGCISCFCCQEMCPVQAIGVIRKMF